MFIRKSRPQFSNFVIGHAKRLLQHNRHEADIPTQLVDVRFDPNTNRGNDVEFATAIAVLVAA